MLYCEAIQRNIRRCYIMQLRPAKYVSHGKHQDTAHHSNKIKNFEHLIFQLLEKITQTHTQERYKNLVMKSFKILDKSNKRTPAKSTKSQNKHSKYDFIYQFFDLKLSFHYDDNKKRSQKIII